MNSMSLTQLSDLNLDLRLPEDLEISQDSDYVHLRIECADASQATQARIAVDGPIFGMSLPPYYLPLIFPHPLESEPLISTPSPGQILIRLQKSQKGQDFPNLSSLQPQLVPDESQAQVIKNTAPTSQSSTNAAGTNSVSEEGTSSILSQTLAKENEKRRLRGEECPLIDMELAESERKMQGIDLASQANESQLIHDTETDLRSEKIQEFNQQDLPTATAPPRMVGSNASKAQGDSNSEGPTSDANKSTSASASRSNHWFLELNGKIVFHSSSSRVRSMSRIHEVQGDQDDCKAFASSSSTIYDFKTIMNRKNQAEKFESSKWDESYYLDNFIDPEKEISALLRWKNPSLKSTSFDPDLKTSEYFQLSESKRSNLLVLTCLLFSYLYDLRCNLGDISSNVESGYTISKLSRCLSCECMPYIRSSHSTPDHPGAPEIRETLRESFRRALVVPLYRNWELCEAALKDLQSYFDGSSESRKSIIKALKSIEKSLGLTQENNAGREDVLKGYIKSVKGVRKWVEATEGEGQSQVQDPYSYSSLKDEDLAALGSSLWASKPEKDEVGKVKSWKLDQGETGLQVQESQEDFWEIELLEQCARQVEEEEEGGGRGGE